MFDNPEKELERLEEELLAAEDKDDDFERFYAEIYGEFGAAPAAEEAPQEQIDQPRQEGRNYANGYGTRPEKPVTRREETAEDYEDTDSRSVPVRKKKKGNGGLVLLACLECLGIIGVVLWWVLRIL